MADTASVSMEEGPLRSRSRTALLLVQMVGGSNWLTVPRSVRWSAPKMFTRCFCCWCGFRGCRCVLLNFGVSVPLVRYHSRYAEAHITSLIGFYLQCIPFSVLLHAEHITLPRRLLRLPPRSLLPSAGGIDAATFTLRLCGVSAAEEGIALAQEELVKPFVGRYCDAELLYREQRPRASSSLGGQVRYKRGRRVE